MKEEQFLSEEILNEIENYKCPILDKYEQEERGNRSHFVRVNVTMSPEMLKHLKSVGAELQALGRSDTDVSSLLRSAAMEFLSQITEFLHEKKHDEWIDAQNRGIHE